MIFFLQWFWSKKTILCHGLAPLMRSECFVSESPSYTHTQRSSLLISLAFLDVIKLTTETNCQKILLKKLTMPRQMVYPRNQHLDASEPKSKTLANHMCFDHIESCKAQTWLLVSLLWPFPVSGSHLARYLKKSFV